MAVLSIISERWLDEVVLQGVDSNIDGDQTANFQLPPGLGDVALMELGVDVGPLATALAAPELRGVRATIVTGTSNSNDIIGVERWSYLGAAVLATYFSPDPLVLWRQSESLQLAFQEVDTNATPTADLVVRVKVVRVRPIESAAGPVRLVR